MAEEQVHWDDVSEGQEISLNEPMSSQRLVMWAAASGDFYQIHYDEGFAVGTGLEGVIVHGALKGMLAAAWKLVLLSFDGVVLDSSALA